MHRFAGAVFFLVVVLLPFFLPYSAHAQFPIFSQTGLVPCGNNIHITTDEKDQDGNVYLCIYDECTTCGLVTLAKNLIQFAVFLAVIVAALLFTYAGALYLFSASNPGNISKAHRIFWDVLLGLVFVLAAWMVIDVIMKVLYGDGPQNWGPWNEVLCGATSERDCRVKETPRGGTAGAPPPPGGGTLPPGGGNNKYPGDRGCPAPNSGWCSIASLGAFGGNAYMAGGICMGESHGDPNLGSRVDRCKDGNSFSWGLFQINLTVHQLNGLNCPRAFCDPANGKCYKNYSCRVYDQVLFNRCVAAAKDPAINIAYAVQLSQGGTHWGQWGANGKRDGTGPGCHFPP